MSTAGACGRYCCADRASSSSSSLLEQSRTAAGGTDRRLRRSSTSKVTGGSTVAGLHLLLIIKVEGEGQLRCGIAHAEVAIDTGGVVGRNAGTGAETTDGAE